MKTAYEYTHLCVQKYLDLTLSTTDIWYDPHTLCEALRMIDNKAKILLALFGEEPDNIEFDAPNAKIDLSAFEGQNYIIDCVLEDLKEN